METWNDDSPLDLSDDDPLLEMPIADLLDSSPNLSEAPEDIFGQDKNSTIPNVIEPADSLQLEDKAQDQNSPAYQNMLRARRQEFDAARALLAENAGETQVTKETIPTNANPPLDDAQATASVGEKIPAINDGDHPLASVIPALRASKHVFKTHELPANFQKKFLVSDNVPGKFFFHDRQQQLAFADQGGKLVTADHQPEVIRSMIELAKEKGWSSVSLKGSNEFKREA